MRRVKVDPIRIGDSGIASFGLRRLRYHGSQTFVRCLLLCIVVVVSVLAWLEVVNHFGRPGINSAADLFDASKKEIAMELTSSAENASLDWRAQYGYIEDVGDGRGYTGGIIGFTSGTGDMLEIARYYAFLEPHNTLAKYIPALQNAIGSDSHEGLGVAFVIDWKTAASDTLFRRAQDHERDTVYFTPAVTQAKADGLHALGQFMYYDATVMHGPGSDYLSFGGIRKAAMQKAKTPAEGGDEVAYLDAFLDVRKSAMLMEGAHRDTDRIDTEQRVFLRARNLNLDPPLHWSVYGSNFSISESP